MTKSDAVGDMPKPMILNIDPSELLRPAAAPERRRTIRVSLPDNIPKRGLSLAQAAEYCGVSDKSLQRHGPEPTRIGERLIYDRRVLDQWLDGLAHLPSAGVNPIEDPEDQLLKAIHARKTALRHAAPKPQRKGTLVLAAPRPPADKTS